VRQDDGNSNGSRAPGDIGAYHKCRSADAQSVEHHAMGICHGCLFVRRVGTQLFREPYGVGNSVESDTEHQTGYVRASDEALRASNG
jgi:hypothetical protein